MNRAPILFNSFAGLQWLSFMFANTIVIPLSVGGVLHLGVNEVSGMMARSFIITGLACLAAAYFGHRMPLMEGQSGNWWSAILSLASVFLATGANADAMGGAMALGIIASGVMVALFGIFRLERYLARLFTPMVMAVLLLLLSAQLIHIFFDGMMGIQSPNGQIDPGVALISIALVLLVSALTLFSRGLLGNFSILIGMCIGWVTYVLVFGQKASTNPSIADIVQPFAWGKPTFSTGIFISMLVIGLVNTTNTVATLRASTSVFDQEIAPKQYRKSLVVTGVFTLLAGVFSIVPYAPYTSSIGFLRTTRILARSPFVIGATLLIILGVVPPFVGFFASMPMSVGDAVLFVAYLQLFGSALQNIDTYQFNFRTIFRIAFPVLTGLAILSTPAQAFAGLPGIVQPLCSNGMLVGIILSIILESSINWNKLDTAT